ncbi:34140_t:CDS:2, partial [Racocetra persica]
TNLKEVENYFFTNQGCNDRLDTLNTDDIIEECDEETKSSVSDISIAIYEPNETNYQQEEENPPRKK